MNEITEKENIVIENMIYEIRGKQVMLDSDLAKLYECKNGTKDINKTVKRNLSRFPEDFYFQLSQKEYENLKFQNGTSKSNSHGGVRKLPFAFTEQGVAMLATVIRTSIANEMSVKIMRAFVAMRRYLSNNFLEQKYINNLVLKDHQKIKILENTFNELNKKEKTNEIYFNGQIFDAYYKIHEICNKAKKELVIIDAYADNTVLDIIKRLKTNITIITKENNLLTKQDIDKYNKQYHNLKVIFNNTFHDRYFILDNENIYHCGTSINRIGYKTFSITLMNDDEPKESLINKVKQLVNSC